MFTEEYAKKIAKIVEKKKVFLKSDNTDYLLRVNTVTYLYATEEDRTKHIEKMKKLGWYYEKNQNLKEFLHNDLNGFAEDVMVYIAYFKKQLKGLNLED